MYWDCTAVYCATEGCSCCYQYMITSVQLSVHVVHVYTGTLVLGIHWYIDTSVRQFNLCFSLSLSAFASLLLRETGPKRLRRKRTARRKRER
ncbi:hypothetical protein F5884DRAFT_166205 [Xylogone sp. PMI_703]|nr:hypothetical protein F5884DRAFT_166205 [Xylogone sp. PMI_703]